MSREFQLNKLVRSKRLKEMQDQGQGVNYHRLVGEELRAALGSKLVEEAVEYANTQRDHLSELADIQQALIDAAEERGYSMDDVEKRRKELEVLWGGFGPGIFVETVVLADDDPWVSYYAARPDCFPEVTE
jgi:predicted house-cleaning noncanonical NTP pyrophosphatase (MazG superfamily)